MPYLPLIGPPPLRVQAVKSPSAAVVKFEAFQPAATNLPAAAGTNALSIVAAVGATNGPDASAVAAMPLVAPATDGSLGATFAGSVFSLPAPDLLGITPQMLAAYFRPIMVGTNSAALSGPFHVSFIPPLPPDKSSHAEYHVK
jgi:hypothetical protein